MPPTEAIFAVGIVVLMLVVLGFLGESDRKRHKKLVASTEGVLVSSRAVYAGKLNSFVIKDVGSLMLTERVLLFVGQSAPHNICIPIDRIRSVLVKLTYNGEFNSSRFVVVTYTQTDGLAVTVGFKTPSPEIWSEAIEKQRQ